MTAQEKPLLKKCRTCVHEASCNPTRKPPSVNALLRMDFDRGGCMTPDHHFTEPDGHSPNGCPSWMLILGLV